MSAEEQVRLELEDIVAEELKELQTAAERVSGAPERAKKRMLALLDSYQDTGKAFNRLKKLRLFDDISLSLMKTIILDDSQMSRFGNQVAVDIQGQDVFWDHPGGRYFRLEPGKKYRLLVAFLPEGEKQ